ncbi:hypothetical protein P8C59_006802 [Phyllachora maydis]|uniref:Uncharacterized protein n=1 Tax=Phyllachora maydis TaxID=1825666 RepID=A0AAD9I7E9_9PEZI|nr:hypothetical protein P8C59_006802 [Phyllachora maydis]
MARSGETMDIVMVTGTENRNPGPVQDGRNLALLDDYRRKTVPLLEGEIVGAAPPTPDFLVGLLNQRHGELAPSKEEKLPENLQYFMDFVQW